MASLSHGNIHNDKYKPTSCNAFVESGELFELTKEEICVTCGWVKSTHHEWSRMLRPNGDLGMGWSCKVCGRTAYDLHGRCDAISPPIDYPPCVSWSSLS